MDDEVRFNLLREVAAKLGVEVRHEEVKTEDAPPPGGLCRIAGNYVLIINARTTMPEKSRIMLRALRQFDLDGIYIKPAIRELLDGTEQEAQAGPTEHAAPRFIVEQNAGKMAKWLRMAGFDARLFTGDDEDALLADALAENRILLTRDRRIMKRRLITGGRVRAILIESDRFRAQVRQVAGALGLDRGRLRPGTICLRCNRRLEPRAKETIAERVPPYVYRTQEHFAECPACGRLYWRGTHWRAMIRTMDEC